MADVRESILVRLLAILNDQAGFSVVRNVVQIDDLAVPALVLFDGDETSFDGDTPSAGQPNRRFFRMTMTPEIVVKVMGTPESVGTTLNTVRAAIIKAVQTDATLATLHTNAGHIRPLGFSTAMGYGRSGLGEASLVFAITYLLRPDDL